MAHGKEEVQCRNIVYDPQRGEFICADTGEVIEEHALDLERYDWRAFDEEQRLRRERAHVWGIGKTTTIELPSLIRGEERMRARRIVQSETRQKSTYERNIEIIHHVITSLIRKLSLPSVVGEEALKLASQYLKKKGSLRGIGPELLATACVYHVAKRYGRTNAEVSRIAGISKVDLDRAYRKLASTLRLRTTPRVEDYLNRALSFFKADAKTVELARKILEKAKEKKIVDGRNPAGVAAAITILAFAKTGKALTSKQLGELFHISINTIKMRLNELEEILEAEKNE